MESFNEPSLGQYFILILGYRRLKKYVKFFLNKTYDMFKSKILNFKRDCA